MIILIIESIIVYLFNKHGKYTIEHKVPQFDFRSKSSLSEVDNACHKLENKILERL